MTNIIKESIKLIKETEYNKDPIFNPVAYNNDKTTAVNDMNTFFETETCKENVIDIDIKSYSSKMNNNIIETKTVGEQDIVDVKAGILTVNGSLEAPLKMSQIAKINEMGLGTKYVQNIKDEFGIIDGIQCISIPERAELPSYTLYHSMPTPESIDIVNGAVFSGYALKFDIDSVVYGSLQFNAGDFTTIGTREITNFKDNIAKHIPTEKQDMIRSLDLMLCTDVRLIDYKPSYREGLFDFTLEDGEIVIDVIYDGVSEVEIQAGEETRQLSIPKKIIVGKKITDIKSLDINVDIQTFNDDAYYLDGGCRKPNGKDMKRIKSKDMSLNFTTSYDYDSEGYSKLYNMYVNGSSNEGIISPTSAGLGKFSLIAKVGSYEDVKPADPSSTEEITPSRFDSEDLKTPLTPKGSNNRLLYIFPNVLLKSVEKANSEVGSNKTLTFEVPLLPDTSLFNDFTVDNAGETINLEGQKLVSITILNL